MVTNSGHNTKYSRAFCNSVGVVSLDLCSICKDMLGYVRLGYGGLGAVKLG